MSTRRPELTLTTAPFLQTPQTTPDVMQDVLLALIPVVLAACWNFGIGALLTVLAAVLGAVGAEALATRKTVLDRSAVLTGVLLALTLPPGMALWMAFLGGVVAIALGKLVWGGLGQNLFNPALVGRAFLQAAFPTAITTWAPPAGDAGLWTINASLFAPPLLRPAAADVVTQATPLGLAKFEHTATDLGALLVGNTGGSLGETCSLVLILAGAWLLWRRTFDWRLLASSVVGLVVVSGLLHLVTPDKCPGPLFMLLSGGFLLAAVFMVTDPVTTPTTVKGAWIFGLGFGFLVVLIRAYGGLPEGVMYSVLLMNAVTPHLNNLTQPKPFGAKA